jgi:sorbitol-specific phosphotransferase system component IIBC
MQEIGQITALTGDMAAAKVERLLTTGGGCCVAETRETVNLEVRNKCGAGIGDYVMIVSDYDRIRFRKVMKSLVCTAVFIISMGVGNYFWPALGMGAWKEPLSFAAGAILTLAVFALASALDRRQPVFVPGAYEVIPPDRAAALLRRFRLSAPPDAQNAEL